MKPELKKERMVGFGPYLRDGYEVNYLFGLDELCQKCVTKDMVILELGVNNGVSTSLFAHYAKKVIAVDYVKTKPFDEVLKNYDNIEFYNCTFEHFLNLNKDTFDLIYIDGGHDYANVKRDISNFKNRVKEEGFISGHDCNSATPDVEKAVLEFFEKKEIQIFSDSSWLVKLKKT